jgi:hypothetical protein
MNNAIGDTLELLETLDPLEKFHNTGVFVRVGPVYGELPVTRRISSAVLLECTFFGRSYGFQHGRAMSRC